MTIDFDSNHNVIHKINKENFDKALKIIVRKIFITNDLNTRSTFNDVFNKDIIKLCSEKASKDTKTNAKTTEAEDKKPHDILIPQKGSQKTFPKDTVPKMEERKKDTKINNDEREQKNDTKRQPAPLNRRYPFEGINYEGRIIGISQTLYELHTINIKRFPFSSTVLIRTLLECTIQEYITNKDINIKVNGNRTIKDLSIAALLGACSNPSNGNFTQLKKENALVARILNESNNLNDHDELNLVTHGNYREPSSHALWSIERRWYAAVEIMLNEITGQSS